MVQESASADVTNDRTPFELDTPCITRYLRALGCGPIGTYTLVMAVPMAAMGQLHHPNAIIGLGIGVLGVLGVVGWYLAMPYQVT